MLKNLKLLSVLFIMVAFFAGCQKNSDPVTGTEDISLYRAGVNTHVSAVFTLSNSPDGNEVIMFNKSDAGDLFPDGSYSTGGLGTGAGLGSQGALVLSGNYLFAVNAGSDEVSVLYLRKHSLTLMDVAPSGGTMPISLTVHDDLLYVLNAGDDGNISGFRITGTGQLTPIEGSTQPLSQSGAGPAQIEFDPSGDILIVTEKATNSIVTYDVDENGVAGSPMVQASSGDTPFGFEFDNDGHLIVSDAFGGGDNAGAMSSYTYGTGGISLISGPVVNTQTAPCWVVVSKNGKFTYTSNTGTNNISGYKIGTDGRLELFSDGGNTGFTGDDSSPIDMSISSNGLYLFCLNSGNQTISIFRVDTDHGRLAAVNTISGLPVGAAGLVAH